MTPDPGSTSSRFSSKTTVSPSRCTVGPALHGRVAGGDHRHAVVAALGGADGVGDDEVGQVLEELVLDRAREERGRGHDGEQRGEVVVGPGVVQRLDQRLAHGVAGDHDRVDPLVADQPPDLVRVELGHEDDLGADEALAHDAPLGGAVHERRHRQVHQAAAGTLGHHGGRVGDPLVGRRGRCRRRGRRRRPRAATRRPWACRSCRRCRGCRGRRPSGARSRARATGRPARPRRRPSPAPGRRRCRPRSR